MPGGASTIVRLMVVDDEPLALVAVIVYIAGVICKAVGVPQIVPLLVPKLRPAGSAGEIDQLEGLPMMACPALCIWPKVYAVPLLYMKYRLSLRLWRLPTPGLGKSPS